MADEFVLAVAADIVPLRLINTCILRFPLLDTIFASSKVVWLAHVPVEIHHRRAINPREIGLRACVSDCSNPSCRIHPAIESEKEVIDAVILHEC